MTRRFAGRSGRVCSLLVLLFLFALASSASADSLRGRVVDPANQPLSSVTVLILRGQAVVTSATTGADGQFGPVTVPAGRYDISVVAAGLRLAPTSVTIAPNQTADVSLTMTLAARSESVVVSASPIDTTESRTPDSVTVIDRGALDRAQIDTVSDALRLVPGFNVTASGSRGTTTSLFPRGGESDYTMVLVDGIPQNVFGGGFDAGHLSTADVERIEVVRGPQSALFGGGAIGGIVQLISRHGGRPRGDVTVEAGGRGTRASTASVAGSHRAWSFGAGFDWLATDGDTRTFATAGGPVSNDDYTRRSASASLGWSPDASTRVRVDLKAGRNEHGFPGPYGSDPLGLYGGLDRVSRGVNETKGVALNAVLGARASRAHRLQMTWATAQADYASPYGPSEDSHRDGLTGRYQFDASVGATAIAAGAEVLRERADNTFITDASFQEVPVERRDLGFFAEARPSFGGRLFANVGVRLERIERRALDSDGFSRPRFDSSTVWSANPKLSLAWYVHRGEDASVWGWTKIRGGAGSGIKPPTAFEIAFTNNPGLKPERSLSGDLGVEQALANGRVIADATWFRNSYDDLIVAVGSAMTGTSRYQTDNIANARARGLEVGATVRLSSALQARGTWTWLDTEILAVDALPGVAPAPYAVGDGLIRRPRRAGSLEVNWTQGRLSLFTTISGRGRMPDFEPNYASSVFANPSYVTTNVGGSIRVARAVEVYGRLSNAFDRSFEEVFGYPTPGRTASIGLRVTPGR